MTEISQRYSRLAAAFAEKIAAVPDERWDRPSPCPGWTAHDVVGHVVTTQGMFLGFVGGEMRSPRAFGPAVEPPPGADAQTELLAFLGRRA
jgi:uncharacterized protein (TIGR03083 family)